MNDSDRRSHGPMSGQTDDDAVRTARMRLLNDLFRITGLGGRQVFTQGVRELGLLAMIDIRMRIAEFTSFTPDNDPFHEHDFGSFDFQGHLIFWKIDYYDKALSWISPDPTDPELTTRLLTIMLASEY